MLLLLEFQVCQVSHLVTCLWKSVSCLWVTVTAPPDVSFGKPFRAFSNQRQKVWNDTEVIRQEPQVMMNTPGQESACLLTGLSNTMTSHSTSATSGSVYGGKQKQQECMSWVTSCWPCCSMAWPISCFLTSKSSSCCREMWVRFTERTTALVLKPSCFYIRSFSKL